MPSWSTLTLAVASGLVDALAAAAHPRPAVGRGRGRVIVADALLLRQPGPEHGDPGHPVPRVEPHHDDPARGAAVAVDGGHVGAHHLAVLADEKELLVRLGDDLGGGHSSGLLGLEGDELDALAAPVGAPEAGDLDPLAVARLREDEHVGARPADVHAHDLVACAGESDADHPRGIAAHRPDLGLVEAGDLAQRGREQDLVLARGDLDPGPLAALVNRDCTDSPRAE